MGSGKKKDKKKRRRERSSTDEEDYNDYDRVEKYSSKRKGDSYIVEDSRPKTLLAIADNYSYEKSDKKQRRKSKYEDIPETEEYVYDQFGEIVQTSRDMSLSPESSDDGGYDYKLQSSKYKEIYEKSVKLLQRKGPATPSPPPSPPPPKHEKHKKAPKSQVKSSVVNSVDASNYQRKSDLMVIGDSPKSTKKKEVSKETNYVLTDYSQKKGSHTLSKLEKHKKIAYELEKQDASQFKSNVKSSVNYIDHAPTNYSQKNIPLPPSCLTPPPPPPPPESEYPYEQGIIESDKSKQQTAPVKSILKKSKSEYDNSSNYSYKKDSSSTSDYIIKTNESNYVSASYTKSKPSNEQTEYSQTESYINGSESTQIDYNSADYILKKIREQTKFKPSSTETNISKSDYGSESYSQKSNFPENSNYESNYTAKSSIDLSSSYKENIPNKQTEYVDKRSIPQPTDYTSTYARTDTNYTYDDNAAKQGNVSSDYTYDSSYTSSGYKPQKDVYQETDYKTPDVASDPYAYFGEQYNTSAESNYTADRNSQKLAASYPTDYAQDSSRLDYAKESNRYDDYARESNRYDNYARESKTVDDYTKIVDEYAEELKTVDDYARDSKRVDDYVVGSNRADDYKELNKVADYARESHKVTDYAKESNRVDDYARESNRVGDYAKESNRVSDYARESNKAGESNRYDYEGDSSMYNDYAQKQDSRENVQYSTNNYGWERSPPAPPPPPPPEVLPAKKSATIPLPPGVDWPYEESEQSTYDDYEGWRKADEEKQTKYQDKKSENKTEKSRSFSRQEVEPVRDEPAKSASSSESLSIEETNKLRAKLGLKPLTVDSGSSSSQEKTYAERDDVHAPAGNISDKKNEEKMRERMEAIREKRKINKKLQKVKGLGEEDDPVLDSAAAWVAKSRIQEKEKALAEKRAQMLEEMDEEFGVTKMMTKSILKKRSKYDEYGSRNLHGMRVEHRASDLANENYTILTLQDKDVLDEDEDVLYNVNVRESEKARLNLKNKNKRPGYQAYDEFDEETGEFKVRTVLDKYDDEIEGQKMDSFRINTDGTADTEAENHIDKIRAILKSQQVSLKSGDLKLARDYFTSEEMVSFKKPGRKKKKIRKREVLKADDLLKMEMVDSLRDRGSRKLKSALKNSNRVFEEDIDTSADMDVVPAEVDELDYFVAVHEHMQDEEPLLEDDEAEQELQIALQRSRRAKLKTNINAIDENSTVEKVAKEVLNKQKIKEEDAESSSKLKKKKGAIILDSTSEFCRTLGDLPTLSNVLNTETENKTEDDMDIEELEANTILSVVPTVSTSGWEQVEITEEPKEEESQEDDDGDVLEAEPIPTGLAATLHLANMKGYLKDGKEKVRKFDPLNLPETKAEVDIEKLRDEEKNKYTRGYERERDRDRYDPYAWKEKANYKPDIKLEYVDNKGRQMNQKEAFRLLSHKFHGKGSGKLKTEKRSKKLLDEKKLQMMSSIDTPLNTSALFKDKQKQSQSAYLVLSGGGKNILSGETLKK